jgi:hypothetical protein
MVMNNRGNTLVMVLISAGLASIVSLIVADMMKLSIKSSNVAANNLDFEILGQEINATIKNNANCEGFAKDATGADVNAGAANNTVDVTEIQQKTAKLFKVGEKVSSGTTVESIRLIPVNPAAVDEPGMTVGGVAYAGIRRMRLEVKLKRAQDAIGRKDPVKTFPVRVYLTAGGQVGTCERIPDDPSSLSINDATGKVDWYRDTRFSTRPTKTKFVGTNYEYCQPPTVGTGTCQTVMGQTAPQRTVVIGCSDGKAAFTVSRGRRIVNPPHNDYIREEFTTYCSLGPDAIAITGAPAAGATVDPDVTDFDGDSLAGYCEANPTLQVCIDYVAAGGSTIPVPVIPPFVGPIGGGGSGGGSGLSF